jgi:hypothetical protein
MFYIYGEQWVKNGEKDGGHARVYKIGLKTGKSFLNLSRTYNNLISNVLGDFECQATPNVFFSNGLFHMVFCYRSHNDFRDNAKNSYRIGYAFSTDLLTWVRNDEILTLNSFGAWDSNMHCYPSVFNLKDKWYLMYNGNQFGKFSFGIFELNIQSFS